MMYNALPRPSQTIQVDCLYKKVYKIHSLSKSPSMTTATCHRSLRPLIVIQCLVPWPICVKHTRVNQYSIPLNAFIHSSVHGFIKSLYTYYTHLIYSCCTSCRLHNLVAVDSK